MKTLVTTTLALAAFATVVTATPDRARAAGSDLSYDSVTKFIMGQNSGGPPPAPGTFQPDFQTASAPPQNSSHGGMFGKLMGGAMGMMAAFKSGTAERHYYGSTKFRTDNVAQGTGDITDCTARTLTHLDLNAKTYHVTSLDQPEAPSSGGGHSGAPGPAATDDGTKMAIDMTTTALGPMTIEGVATNGYTMNMKMTITKADGETATSNSAMTAYYSSMDDPHTSCPEHISMSGPGGGMGPGGASIAQMMMAMKGVGAKGDSRFKVTTSGPAIPAGKLAMWEMMTMKGDSGPAQFGVETERGNVHQLSDGDPAFSPPADFTKV